ncbi:hypothetical protein [Verrucomicrobium spinosum]|uniref:hypothetical protein n=1 Tax=Verrucomicrobium spinosum TaxID=2736 RepID=UPI0009467B2F|nr:hypothetical protein [Verrucomicrobium spinosum]
MTDLIQHFRTLLVHQVDPAAAEEDLSPEVADMVRQQSAMVQAESLLRVMDGLAEVDARMRWASNKLLHLEIGVIQAVQTLGEVTLSEVIEALGGAPSPDLIARRAAPPVPSVPWWRLQPRSALGQRLWRWRLRRLHQFLYPRRSLLPHR